jgi:hypothetical protein
MRLFCYFFLLFFVSLGCVRVEEINSIPKYSVYCVLNPDEAKIELFLSNTYAINQNFPIDSGKYIRNAKVVVKSNNRSVTLFLNEKTKKYESPNLNFLKENNEYSLQILINQDTLNAQTFIPSKPNLTVEESTIIKNEAQIRVKWLKDKINKTYYRLLGSVDTGAASNPFFYWDNEFGIWRTSGEYSSENTIRSPIGNFVFPSTSKEVDVLISLESLDNYWYQFKNKLDALLIRDSFTKKFESPIYYQSNITNAVGVFGAFTKTEINLKIKN